MATALNIAANAGDLALLRKLIDGGAALEPKLDDYTPLHVAAQRGDAEMAELLLARGAKVDFTYQFNRRTALMWAAERDDHASATKLVELLIRRGANVNLL